MVTIPQNDLKAESVQYLDMDAETLGHIIRMVAAQRERALPGEEIVIKLTPRVALRFKVSDQMPKTPSPTKAVEPGISVGVSLGGI